MEVETTPINKKGEKQLTLSVIFHSWTQQTAYFSRVQPLDIIQCLVTFCGSIR